MTTAKQIINEVADKHGMCSCELKGKRRDAATSGARFEAMHRLRNETVAGKKSLTWIGRQFGNRDHSAVIHAIKRHEQQKETSQ